jgi:CubicO group peptidase (beta-lactamase class C family)
MRHGSAVLNVQQRRPALPLDRASYDRGAKSVHGGDSNRGFTMASGFINGGLQKLHDRLSGYVERREVPGLVALVAHGGEVHFEVLGHPALDDPAPLQRDAIFRIASLTKPITAAAAMALVDDGLITIDEPVEKYLPELANRRVLRRIDGPIDDTIPAKRPITIEDLLSFRLGFGIIMVPPGSYPIQVAEEQLGIKTLGPPWPPPPFDGDEWIRRFATLPLMAQPGETWLYNTGAQILGVLIERVTGEPLEDVLRARLLDPLGMDDTSFGIPPAKQSRFTAAYSPDMETGQLRLLDPQIDGVWKKPLAFADASAMLVSTVDDYWTFVNMLLGGGTCSRRVLSSASVAAMTQNHLTDDQRAPVKLFLGEHGGWGYGMAAPTPITGEPPIPWGMGWNGGTGTTWISDPVRDLTGILFTQRAMTSPQAPAVFVDFWEAAYAAIEQ